MRTILLFGISYFTLIFFARSQNFGNSGYCQGDNNINVSPWNSAVGNMKDAVFMERANLNMDHTAIRLNIGDDAAGLKDMLDVGFYNYQPDPTGPYPWISGIKLFSSGDLHVKNDIVGKTLHAQAPFNEEKGIWFSDGPSVGSWKISKEANSPDLVIGDGSFANSIRIRKLTAGAPARVVIGRDLAYNGEFNNITFTCLGTGIFSELGVLPGTNWSDYVFDKGYKLMPLDTLSQFIAENHHLPEVPTTKEVNEKGIKIGEMNALLLKKVEELTLYLIDLKRELDAIKSKK